MLRFFSGLCFFDIPVNACLRTGQLFDRELYRAAQFKHALFVQLGNDPCALRLRQPVERHINGFGCLLYTSDAADDS